ncbi:hypothetical protein [Aneurinibacillus migulanus]|uniref:Uncharacterized protein n=1 Tax=Aneurinibacillus migulanus TaxID=47500 RepID=A0A1G8V2Q1_ANEMI|nr:hypothetical protein [Aneurinibacillus migulanus]MED0896256.1 hypothetical protein [Aneurinibacillus migulanus]MED1618074.1 hypothetical protein [Aneurinibacillus migulanus]MED4732269.1 hypothetical protein [Aneurinibacillus migulanus]SDJ60137.1 hypothetical protein SAMN04487909_1226 [Aneurinibacillus migulanus]GED15627.1 hypothetical protein AMI01nite_36180 [Aneurinibacillus migulanus]
MKTIICREPGVMTLEEVRNPTLIKRDDVKIAIKRIGNRLVWASQHLRKKKVQKRF